MRVLDARMHALDKPMCVLDRQLKRVEARQEAAATKAEAPICAVLARTIARGVAKPFSS